MPQPQPERCRSDPEARAPRLRRLTALAALVLAASVLAGSQDTRAGNVQPAAPAREAAPRTATAAPADGAGTKEPAGETGALNPTPGSKPEAVLSSAEREAAYMARLDEVVAPVRGYDLPQADAEHVSAAIKALSGGKVEEGAAQKALIKDALAKKLIDWYRLRQGYGEAPEIKAFLEQNPDWPSRELLQRRMEEALFAAGGSTDVIASYFKDGNPQSPAGMALLASVHLAHNEPDKARELAAKVWRAHDLSADLERGFLSRFGSLLTEADHKWRLDRLLIDDVRYQSARDDRAQLVKRVIPLLSKPEQAKAQARLAVFMRSKGAKAPLKPVPDAKHRDWGLVFHKIQQQRRAGKLDTAAKLMLEAPTDPAVVVSLNEWWGERQGLAYLALKANKAKLAYDLVRDAGPLEVNALNEQSFLAGWIALRYLKDYAAAEKHFAALSKTADGPLSRSKAHYWLARALEAKGEAEKAKAEYRAAASETDTFHALLAMQKLEPGRRRLTIEPPAEPTAGQIKHFRSLEVAQAVALAKAAKLSSIPRILLQHLATLEDNEAWGAMVAHLARSIGDTQASVRIGKAAIAKGHNLLYYSYPVHALPTYKPLRAPPETAFLLAIARQETEFDTTIVSGAGAQGILQVMKGTAKHVCRDYKIKCDQKALLNDPSYNTMIASAYVGDQMADFSGSYVLGLSSYNAGPGRTREWIEEFGDPRSGRVDPLDWIERIPIQETRRYVVKVLSNIQIYRARLGEEGTALRLDQDLNRAREAAQTQPRHKKGTDTTSSE